MGKERIAPPLTGSSQDDSNLRIQVVLAEYNRIKEEIFHHKTSQQTILNFIIILTAVEIPLLADSLGVIPDTSIGTTPGSLILLILPIPFGLLGLYHSAYTMRIHNLAEYLDGSIRLRIETLIGTGYLRERSYFPTPTIRAWWRSKSDGRIIYLSLAGMKALPQLLPLVTFWIGCNMIPSTLVVIWFLGDVGLLIASVTGQHD